MKLARCLLALALLGPAFCFANSVDFSNSNGTLVGTNAGLALTSTLISVQTGSTLDTGLLGSLAFSTGALTSGSLQSGGTFAAGGTFQISGNGTDGIPNGVIFSGTFSSPVTWTVVTLANGTHNYQLTGALTGTWFTGQTVNGATVQLTVNTGKGFFNGSVDLSSGNTDISGIGLKIVSTPEPGTLAMFGTGLIGIGTLVRRRLRA
jgi:hypothetical protein